MLKKTFQPTGLWFLWITLMVFAADWGTKELANSYLDPYVPVQIFPFFNLTLAYNTGAAFSFLDNASLWPNILFSVIALGVSIAILVWLARLPRSDKMMSIGLTLILGGALGNLWDRVRYEHVIDFVDLYVRTWHWPVFNVADMAVSLGAFLIIWRWMIVKK
jgi:signal peptidase II